MTEDQKRLISQAARSIEDAKGIVQKVLDELPESDEESAETLDAAIDSIGDVVESLNSVGV